ncbi:hypothetical protein EYC84_010245 [Monilinia fructicola]|uniref:Uncharacterized protein n=1 Tax=Monilinia fructicola TaxID=38448 RepID=A0A5M9JD41_MONFR|nr:hypothetical protein EYC84_010245 [Monilinia fructicola]
MLKQSEISKPLRERTPNSIGIFIHTYICFKPFAPIIILQCFMPSNPSVHVETALMYFFYTRWISSCAQHETPRLPKPREEIHPDQTRPCHAMPCHTKPNQTKPNHTAMPASISTTLSQPIRHRAEKWELDARI